MIPPQTPPRLVTLILLAALSTLSLNMFLPSLANIATDFQADYALVSLSVGGYLAVTAVVQLIAGPLSDRIGRRPVVLTALALFTLASIGCLLAQDIHTFLICRMLQAAIASGYGVSLAIVRDTAPPERATALIATIGMFMAVAPMLGPVIGGLLDAGFGWRASFVVYTVAGTVMALLCLFDLGETRAARPASAGSGPGATTLLRTPLFWGYALCGAFSVGAFYVFLAGASVVAQSAFGVGTAQLGVYIGSITAGFMAGSFVSSRLSARVPGLVMMLAGRLVACIGLSIGLVLVLAGVLSPVFYFASTICVGLGNGLTMPAALSGALSINRNYAGSAAGFGGALSVAVGAVLTSLTGVLLAARPDPALLLGLMLGASVVALACVCWIHLMTQRE
ncbi:MAG: Bcr/CflA family efflux MFS transporter [Sedimentitalea sp.]